MPEIQQTARIRVEDVSVSKPFSRKLIFLIVFAVLAVHATMVLVALPEVASPLKPSYNMGFGDLYDLIAKNLDEGNGYRVDPAMGETMFREPAYPFLLAAAFKVGGYGITQARIVSVALGFIVAFLLFRLTRRITGDSTTALIAALLFLLH